MPTMVLMVLVSSVIISSRKEKGKRKKMSLCVVVIR